MYVIMTKNSVYHSSGYCDIIGMAAEKSMNSAVNEVKALPNYADNGEVTQELRGVF